MSTPGNPSPDEFLYHGTVRPRLKNIFPAWKTGKPETFTAHRDPSYAYATQEESAAWGYAEKAWHSSGLPHIRPRVYQVHPAPDMEPDQREDSAGYNRGTNTGDVRSRRGFRVNREMDMPEDMRNSFDWEAE